MWTVPVSMIEKNIKLNIRNKIHVCLRNEHYLGRCGNHHGRQRDIDPYVDIHLSPAFGGVYERDEKDHKNTEEKCLLFHMRSLFEMILLVISHRLPKALRNVCDAFSCNTLTSAACGERFKIPKDIRKNCFSCMAK